MNNQENDNITLKDLESMNKGKEIDTLLECLLFLSKYYQRPASLESLTSGLAIYDTLMTPKMFEESAKRIKLSVNTVRRDISEISEIALPSVMMLDSDKSCILLELNHKENKAKVIMPHINLGELEISIEELEELYNGYLLIIKPEYNFSNRISENVLIKKPKEWFWDTMRSNKKIYLKVAMAAVLINLFIIATPLFTMNVYDRVLPNNALSTLWVLAGGILIVMVFDFILKLMRAHFIEVAGKRADVVMSSKIFDQLLNIRLDSKPASTGQFVSRLQSFESVREFFTSATIAAIVDLPFIILFMIIISYIGGPVAYISVFTVIIAFLFSYFMQKPIRKMLKNLQKKTRLNKQL